MCTLYSSTWPRPLIQSMEKPSGLYWHDIAACRSSSRSSGSCMSAWQESPLKWWSVWSFWDLQWDEARLCPGISLFQLVLHLCPQCHYAGCWWGSGYLLLHWGFCIWPSLSSSQVKDTDWSIPSSAVCWWLHTHGTQIQLPANLADQVLRCLKTIWPYH